ncbi:alpha/beta fold hydrolase, partial [Duganella sp. CF517]|uniref:alpha/beta fold hydrolase n=1 Tax=Duganella sp. CF517 TaxID=1881038 RepID=UPI0035A306CA
MVGGAVAAAAAVATALPLAAVTTAAEAAPAAKGGPVAHSVSTITTRDGVEIYYKDWGPRTGQPVVLSHGWPLNADSWESAAFHLANNGFRVITHDRRGHGRSSQPWDGNDMDHYA